MTREQAVALHDSKFWEPMTLRERAMFQMFEERLCMPFDVFQEAVEATLGRPVFTHEFASVDRPGGLKAELMGGAPAPTLDQILALIPADKRVLIAAL